MRRRAAALAIGGAVAIAAAGCGGSGAGGPTLRVAAASSLEQVLTSCTKLIGGAKVRLQFAGSDQLAAQIRAGVKPELFMAANTGLPRALAKAGLVDRPVGFATNQLVLAVPSGEHAINSIDGLASGNPTIAIGSASVPVGIYTRQVLSHLPIDERIAILSHVRSQEPDVKGIVGKLLTGAVDAGFVYASDVKAAGGKLRAIPLPAALQATVVYAMAVVKGAPQQRAARLVVNDVLHGACAKQLRAGGFGPPPRA